MTNADESYHTAPHDFGADIGERGAVGWCLIDECHGFAVSTGDRWRDPTAHERVSVICAMWEDLIYAQAFQIMHGKELGLQRYRYLRGLA